MITIIDLQFQNVEKAIASFLVKGPEGYLLVETGPESTFPTLEKSLEKMGIEEKEIKGVLLTHIHLDHSGAAWRFAEKKIPIYVHAQGAPHLISTQKLWYSAGTIYGAENMEKLWGTLKDIHPSMIRSVDDGDKMSIAGLKVQVFYTPGHANHHVVYDIEGNLFAGDTLGACIDQGPTTVAAPPPDLNIELWIDSVKKISKNTFSTLVFTHFSIVDKDLDQYYDRVVRTLHSTKDWMKKSLECYQDEKKIVALWEKEQEKIINKSENETLFHQYAAANPPFMSVLGFKKYFKQ